MKSNLIQPSIPDTLEYPREFLECSNKDPRSSISEIKKLYDALNTHMEGMELELYLIVLTIVCRENLIFLGRPGIGKTLSIVSTFDLIKSAVGSNGNQLNLFQTCLHKYTQLAEVVGPFNLQALMSSEHSLIRIPKIQISHFAMIDEFFNASSALLNTLLTIMNDRKYYESFIQDGNNNSDTPLIALLAASNDVNPGLKADLAPVVDRFAIIHEVKNIIDKSFPDDYDNFTILESGEVSRDIKEFAKNCISPLLLKAWENEKRRALKLFLKDDKHKDPRQKTLFLQDNSILGHFGQLYISLFRNVYSEEFQYHPDINPASMLYKIARFVILTHDNSKDNYRGIEISHRRILYIAKLMLAHRLMKSIAPDNNEIRSDYFVCGFMGKTQSERAILKREITYLISTDNY